jgi:sRNA-binding regulator protein Hfq
MRHFLPTFDSETQPAASCILPLRTQKTMHDSSAIPVRPVLDARQGKAKSKVDGLDSSALPSISPAGPRKLIRPHLATAANPHPSRFSAVSPVFNHLNRWDSTAARGESSHAEAFYFQKQIQSRTLMIFLLEDGERIEGVIEWYDRHSIKVRQGTVRTLIYKSSIKYLYKSADGNQVNGQP